jgi:cathepsin A (carboxypeptidase C)
VQRHRKSPTPSLSPHLTHPSQGNLAWLENLETSFQADFQASKKAPYIPLFSKSNKPAGFVKTAGGKGLFTAGNVTYVQIYDAGHMVPYDQPEAALDMFVRWIMDTPLTLTTGDAVEGM